MFPGGQFRRGCLRPRVQRIDLVRSGFELPVTIDLFLLARSHLIFYKEAAPPAPSLAAPRQIMDNNSGAWFHFFAYLLLSADRIHVHLFRGWPRRGWTDEGRWSLFGILGVCRLFDGCADDLLISSLRNSKKRAANGWIWANNLSL